MVLAHQLTAPTCQRVASPHSAVARSTNTAALPFLLGTGRVKKSGAGGKYTWGAQLLSDGDEEAVDVNDPNYDSGAASGSAVSVLVNVSAVHEYHRIMASSHSSIVGPEPIACTRKRTPVAAVLTFAHLSAAAVPVVLLSSIAPPPLRPF